MRLFIVALLVAISYAQTESRMCEKGPYWGMCEIGLGGTDEDWTQERVTKVTFSKDEMTWTGESVIAPGARGIVLKMARGEGATFDIVTKVALQEGPPKEAAFATEPACMQRVMDAYEAAGLDPMRDTQACAPDPIGCNFSTLQPEEASTFSEDKKANQKIYAMQPFPAGSFDLLYIAPFMTPEQLEWTFNKLVKMLMAGHAKDLVHSDLNLNNIAVGPNGHLLLFDWECDKAASFDNMWAMLKKFSWGDRAMWAFGLSKADGKGKISETDDQFVELFGGEKDPNVIWKESEYYTLYWRLLADTSKSTDELWEAATTAVDAAKQFVPNQQEDATKEQELANIITTKGGTVNKACTPCQYQNRKGWCWLALVRAKSRAGTDSPLKDVWKDWKSSPVKPYDDALMESTAALADCVKPGPTQPANPLAIEEFAEAKVNLKKNKDTEVGMGLKVSESHEFGSILIAFMLVTFFVVGVMRLPRKNRAASYALLEQEV